MKSTFLLDNVRKQRTYALDVEISSISKHRVLLSPGKLSVVFLGLHSKVWKEGNISCDMR
jgi:hypothetical protein